MYIVIILIILILILGLIFIYNKFNKLITSQSDLINSKTGFLSKRIDELVASDTSFNTELKNHDTLPVGTILSYTSAFIDNPKYMMCDGSQLFIAQNTDLFKVIGTTYNKSNIDADLYFNIPDLRGVFLRGNDNDRGIDTNRQLGSLQDWTTANARIPFTTASAGNHTHQYLYKFGCIDCNADSWLASNNDVGQNYQSTTSSGDHIHKIIGGDQETRPTNVTVNFIIKVLL